MPSLSPTANPATDVAGRLLIPAGKWSFGPVETGLKTVVAGADGAAGSTGSRRNAPAASFVPSGKVRAVTEAQPLRRTRTSRPDKSASAASAL